MLVLLEMAVKVGLLTKAAVAQVTLEGLLLVVDVANVTLKVRRDAEGAITVFTPGRRAAHLYHEWRFCTFHSNFTVRAAKMSIEEEITPVGLLACVCSQVSGEVRRSREDFPAVPGGTQWTEKEA